MGILEKTMQNMSEITDNHNDDFNVEFGRSSKGKGKDSEVLWDELSENEYDFNYGEDIG
jgi:hypothetical protein